MLKNFQSKCLEVFKTVYLKMLWFYQLLKRILAYFQKSKTPSVIPFWKAILIYFKVARSIGHFSGHFKWLPWWSGSIYKKWLPWESIEARVLKFCVGLCMTNTHARKKERLNTRTKIYFRPSYLTPPQVGYFTLFFQGEPHLLNFYQKNRWPYKDVEAWGLKFCT